MSADVDGTDWKTLKACGKSFDRVSTTIGECSTDSIFVALRSALTVWKYDVHHNHWEKTISSPDERNSHATIAVDDANRILYMFGENGHIYTIDLATKTYAYTKSSQSFHDGSHARSLVINGEFHVFGGWKEENKAHYVWNAETQDLVEVDRLSAIELPGGFVRGLHYHYVVYLKRKHCVLIILKNSVQIYSYSLLTKECILLPWQLREANNIYSPFVCSSDERYLFQFCGRSQNVWLYNLDCDEVRKSRVKCAIKAKAVVSRDDGNAAEKLVFGFVRRCWILKEFASARFPEMEVIGLIVVFAKERTIHLWDSDEHVCIAEHLLYDVDTAQTLAESE